jgi:hypothetical protein
MREPVHAPAQNYSPTLGCTHHCVSLDDERGGGGGALELLAATGPNGHLSLRPRLGQFVHDNLEVLEMEETRIAELCTNM